MTLDKWLMDGVQNSSWGPHTTAHLGSTVLSSLLPIDMESTPGHASAMRTINI
jgi:hypothetical protein